MKKTKKLKVPKDWKNCSKPVKVQKEKKSCPKSSPT
jgi:hypothetical protein